MPFKTRMIEFNLSPIDIDEASEWLEEQQVEIGMEKADRLRARLLFEEALLNFADRFGDEQHASVHVEKKYGHYRLRLEVEGEKFNPMKNDESDQDELSRSLFSIIDMRAQYSYAVGSNVVRMPLRKQSFNPVLRLIIAIVIATIVGLLGNIIIPDTLQIAVTDAVLDPLANMWVRLLQAISGPVIFFTAFYAALSTKRISDYGGSRFMTLARYFLINAIIVAFSLFCSSWFFIDYVSFADTNREIVSTMLSTILEVVPNNLLEPFFTANTPQLLLIAIVAGYALAAIGNPVSELKTIIQQVNMLGLVIAERTCALVPYFVGLLLCLKIWSHDIGLLSHIWIPMVLSIVIAFFVFMSTVLIVSIRTGAKPLLLVRKLSGPFSEALRTGALDYSSVSKLADSCKRLLGLDEDFAKAVLPLGLVLFMPTSAIGIIVFVLFAANAQNIDITQMWLLAATALAVVLAVATPPLNGANLLAFVVAFSYLGIASDVFLDVMVFDIVFGVLCIALDQSMLQLETLLQAERMGFLDKDVLRAPIENDAR